MLGAFVCNICFLFEKQAFNGFFVIKGYWYKNKDKKLSIRTLVKIEIKLKVYVLGRIFLNSRKDR